MLATVTQIYWLGLKRQRQGDYWPTEQQFLMWEVLHPRGHFGNVRGHCLTGVMTEEVLLAFSRHGPKKLDVLQIPGPSCMTKHPTCSLIFSDLWGNNLFKMIWAKNLTVLHRNIKYWGLRLHNPDAGGSDSIPGQGTRSHMLQPRIHMPQLKMLHAATKMEDPTTKTKSSQKKKKKKIFFKVYFAQHKYALYFQGYNCHDVENWLLCFKLDCVGYSHEEVMPPSNTICAIQITNTTLLTHCTFVAVVTVSNVQKHLMILFCALYDCSQVFAQWNLLLYWFSWNCTVDRLNWLWTSF